MPVFLMYVFTKPPPRFSPGGGCIGVVILMIFGFAGGFFYTKNRAERRGALRAEAVRLQVNGKQK